MTSDCNCILGNISCVFLDVNDRIGLAAGVSANVFRAIKQVVQLHLGILA